MFEPNNYNNYQLNTTIQLVMCEVTRNNRSSSIENRYNYNKLTNPSKYTPILPYQLKVGGSDERMLDHTH